MLNEKSQARSLFDFRDYKAYLKHVETRERARGERRRWAEAMGCQPAYVTLVLNGGSHLSLEQGDRLNRYLAHGTEESHFLLLLIQLARAGTPSLVSYFGRLVNAVLEGRKELKGRIKVPERLVQEQQAVYYSAWYYSAIHAGLSIPGQRTPRAISSRLGLPEGLVREVLGFLVACGLAVQDGQSFRNGVADLHLTRENRLVNWHHSHWRTRAISSLEQSGPDDTHYSAAITLSREDTRKIREILFGAIEAARSVIEPSPSEELFALNIDFFEVTARK